jgi:MerR family copper efflux transcriptional regulator
MNKSANRRANRPTTTSHLTIGAVARRAGVGIDTVRYYEREGLLPPPLRRASGYRDYGNDVVERLRFIRRAKDLGFTLDEIRELLALSSDRERGVRDVKVRAEAKLAAVEDRIRELQRVRRGLKQLITACPGHGPLEHCPILRALGGKDRP